MNVNSVNLPRRIVVSTPAPSMSAAPSMSPTFYPTISPGPSIAISTYKPPSMVPSMTPIALDTVLPKNHVVMIPVWSMVTALSIVALAIGFFVGYRKRFGSADGGGDAASPANEGGGESKT